MDWWKFLQNAVICSDSFSANQFNKWEVLGEARYFICLYGIRQIANNTFSLVPVHVGVEGNEEVDGMTKQAMKHSRIEVNVPLSKSEIKGILKGVVKEMWQEKWYKEVKGWHQYNIQRQVG